MQKLLFLTLFVLTTLEIFPQKNNISYIDFYPQVENYLKKQNYEQLYIFLDKNQNLINSISKTSKIYSYLLKSLSQTYIGQLNNANKNIKYVEIELQKEKLQKKFFYLNKGVQAIIKYRKGKYINSLNKLNSSVQFLNNLENKTKLDKYFNAIFLRFIARVYAEIGIPLQAINNIQQSSLIFKKLKSFENVSVNHKFLGRIYFQSANNNKDYKKFALLNYLIALKGFKKYKLSDETKWIYTIIADFYLQNKKSSLAKTYQDSAYMLINEKKDMLLLGLAYNNYGKIFEIQNKLNKAIIQYLKAIITYTKNKNVSNRAVTYYNLSNLYLIKNKLAKSKSYADSTLKYSKLSQNKQKQQKANKLLAKIFIKLKKYKQALIYFKNAEKLNKEIQENQNHNKAISFQILYEVEQKEHENEILKYENQRIQSNILLLAITFIIAELLLVFIFLYFRSRLKTKQNKLRLKEIDEQNDLISKNLHDGMSGYLHSLRDSLILKNEKNNDFETEILLIKRTQNELRFLMKQLNSPFYKSKSFNLLYEINDLINFYKHSNSFGINYYIDLNINWDNISYNNKLQIYKLLQELLANIKKHSKATEVSIQIIKENKQMILSVEDNGIGFDLNSSFAGYGFKNMQKRVKEMKAKMKIDTNIGEGTFIYFELPVL